MKQRHPLLLVFVLGVVIIGGAAAWIQLPWISDDPEYAAIVHQRNANRVQAALGVPLANTPDHATLDQRLSERGFALGAPVLIRIFKRSFELEVWLAKNGRYEIFATYPICLWSGRLGPKVATGDKQAPEGFYSVAANQMNPSSRWHRSFNVGFPNAFDAAHGRTGSALMVHGGCSSAGCYAMTNPVIDEIWKLTSASLSAGQKRFQVQIYPFAMTAENLEAHRDSPYIGFWRQLKAGHDVFEATRLPPDVRVCAGAYAFVSSTALKMKPLVRGCTPSKVIH